MSVLSWLGGIGEILSAVKKKKVFVLWYKELTGAWIIKSKPLSYRQCRKTRTALIALGAYQLDRFAILRDGTKP